MQSYLCNGLLKKWTPGRRRNLYKTNNVHAGIKAVWGVVFFGGWKLFEPAWALVAKSMKLVAKKYYGVGEKRWSKGTHGKWHTKMMNINTHNENQKRWPEEVKIHGNIICDTLYGHVTTLTWCLMCGTVLPPLGKVSPNNFSRTQTLDTNFGGWQLRSDNTPWRLPTHPPPPWQLRGGAREKTRTSKTLTGAEQTFTGSPLAMSARNSTEPEIVYNCDVNADHYSPSPAQAPLLGLTAPSNPSVHAHEGGACARRRGR